MKKKSIWVILGLLSCFFVPVFVAQWLYQHADRFTFQTNNHGHFIKPTVSLNNIKFTSLQGATFSVQAKPNHWRIMLVSRTCVSKTLSRHFFYLHQMRLALGAHKNQVHNLLVIPARCNQDALHAFSKGPLNKSTIMSIDSSNFKALMARFAIKDRQRLRAKGDNVWFIDAKGRVMMQFASSAKLTGIYADIKQLLRASRLG